LEWVGDVVFLAVLAVISLLFFAVLVQREREHRAERRDLLDRLMSRDIHEYKAVTAPEPNVSDPVHVSDEEEYLREIEQMKSGV